MATPATSTHGPAELTVPPNVLVPPIVRTPTLTIPVVVTPPAFVRSSEFDGDDTDENDRPPTLRDTPVVSDNTPVLQLSTTRSKR